MDELDEEDKNNDLLHFLGPVGDYMAYIKCGLRKCDVYYSEILVGRLYVGYLYTLNNFDEEEDFCPIEFINSSVTNLLYIKSQCPGATSIKIFTLSFSYTRGDIWLYEEIPLDIVDSKDLSIMILNQFNSNIQEMANFVATYSIEEDKFYIRDFLSTTGNDI